MTKKQLIYLFQFFLCYQVIGQQTSRFVNEIQVDKNQSVRSSGRVSAIAIRSDNHLGDAVDIMLNGESLSIPFDADGLEYTYFISLQEPVTDALVEMDIEAKIFLINSQSTPSVESSSFRKGQDCEFEISPIAQSEWRSGLNPPSYSRSFTDVNHVIVHHAAGSNSNTNYTQVVRDIYLLHTEVNGWSDIGYNYLVAQNGDLYAGRDPAGGSQDNVLGAHFCGRNATTMGICLLGNYETAQPTNEMWTTLEQLVAFKIKKEELNPLTSGSHPLGDIGHIAGHRDGCSTLCPGENVYNRLASMRESVNEKLSCDNESELSFTFTNPTIDAGRTVTYTNASTGYDSYVWYFEGGNPVRTTWEDGGQVQYENPGLYDVLLVGSKNGAADSLMFEDRVLVKGELKLFPNPIAANKTLTLVKDTPFQKIEIIDSKGVLCYTEDLDGVSKIEMPDLRSGLYIIRLLANDGWTSRRLVIE